MKTFPHFSIAIENMLTPTGDGEQLEIRRMVNDAYTRINKAMFESLKVIAKESPTVMGTQGQGDPEDKEALNYHILLIENMNHYIEEVDARSDTVLDYWKAKAQEEYREHMNLYVDAVIRRPLGKLLVSIANVVSPQPTNASLRNSSSRPRRSSRSPAQARNPSRNARRTLVQSSRSSSTHTMPRNCARAPKRSRSASTSTLATPTTRASAATSSSRCSRSASASTSMSASAQSGSTRTCTRARWRWTGGRTRLRRHSGGRGRGRGRGRE
jgi:hypothetical protein